jgi:hypothetical protein
MQKWLSMTEGMLMKVEHNITYKRNILERSDQRKISIQTPSFTVSGYSLCWCHFKISDFGIFENLIFEKDDFLQSFMVY